MQTQEDLKTNKQKKDDDRLELSRRDVFISSAITGTVGAIALSGCSNHPSEQVPEFKDKKFAMVIDLQRCTGCGGCSIACRNENNTPDGIFWSNKTTQTFGKFPNVNYQYIPTLCNHCENAPCVNACPTSAMHYVEGGIVNHNPDICIGCKACGVACPYNSIYYNKEEPHQYWNEKEQVIEGATASASEVKEKVKSDGPPYYNPARDEDKPGTAIRPKGVPEKCNFCLHRLKKGQLPACVEACPSDARIFGDLNDPNSDVSRLLGKYKSMKLKEHLGTHPKVHYIRHYNSGSYQRTKGKVGVEVEQ